MNAIGRLLHRGYINDINEIGTETAVLCYHTRNVSLLTNYIKSVHSNTRYFYIDYKQ